jgi:hypothetical protein
MRVELVCMRLFDVGAEVDPARVHQLAGRPPQPAPLQSRSPLPRSTAFPSPLEVVLPWPDPGHPEGTVEVRLHPVGVLAIRFRLVVEAAGVEGLDDAARSLRVGGATLDEAAERLASQCRAEIAAALMEPYEADVGPERYDVYCIQRTPDEVPRFLRDHAVPIARLVSGSAAQPLVAAREAAAAKHTLQYTPGDAVVIGWDHAVILDEAGEYEDILDVMELANAELLEFRTYDDYLDRRLRQSFDALDRLWRRGGIFRSARSRLQDISRLRVGFARLTDNLHDTGKIFGDWYIAQLHHRLHERFHVSSWERAVAAKMKTLEDLFHMAQEATHNRRAVALESAIVLLFVISVVIQLRIGH